VTGVTFLTVALGAKRLELLRDLVPKLQSVALTVNPSNPNAQLQTTDMQAASSLALMR
jgi:putative tryptophan/tyrosine transport system substrate-binding protein